MNIISAKIKGIKYKDFLKKELKSIEFNEVNFNTCPPAFLLNYGRNIFGISKWVSPKRTRFYPYERVYNTLSCSKKITVIPIVKDEGKNGDRDFLQWDTISFMSLLETYVIFAYYNDAIPHKTRLGKITRQLFDNDYIKRKIDEITNYKSSALHWNLKEINETLPLILKKTIDSYKKISLNLGIDFHNETGILKFEEEINEGIGNFLDISRLKSLKAQKREVKTVQPKEYLQTASKSIITITNYLGGKYFLTTDETEIKDDKIYLIESKHSKTGILPSLGDIKDGLLKMVLFSNLSEVNYNNKDYPYVACLKLTSNKLQGQLLTNHNSNVLDEFYNLNHLSNRIIKVIETLFAESRENNFLVVIQGMKND